MRFWDSGAIVPLVCAEAPSSQCRSWLKRDPVILVWMLAATEVVSALTRKHRSRDLDSRAFRVAQRRLQKLEDAWNEVLDVDAVRRRAREMLAAHDLRAMDSLHLAAAILARAQAGNELEFVTFDRRLADAAKLEGFPVLSA